MFILLGIAISATVSLIAWLLRTLTGWGAVSGAAVGSLILWPLGWPGFAVLGVFFATSSALGRLLAPGNRPLADPKGGRRDARQVMANGGVAALVAPLEFLTPGLGYWLSCVSIAAATSDTWASEIGALSQRPPRDILNWRVVPPGTSGGVSWFGSSAGLMGGAAIGLVAIVATSAPRSLFLAATAIGFGGMLIDSGLGSSVQARFHCRACDRGTERRVHDCGGATIHRRGWRWLDNDGVNGITSSIAAAVGGLWWYWLLP